ncbi:hypothetical protein [Aquibacillus albus]|uniref:Apea-like HEPN domain-containing protein n=1 Tax=Aquibacillus albus TaxID=1168171 RepID=A0ABS2N088_9BACI|nr:hypothetical protein [Aquibacillus albus]MBM7571565.1 hypothetical protein [Aquibacillus albus]
MNIGNVHQLKAEIEKQIIVSKHDVILAKEFLLTNQDNKINVLELMKTFVQNQNIQEPTKFLLEENEKENIKVSARYISIHLAYCEAVWSLIGSNSFIIENTDSKNYSPLSLGVKIHYYSEFQSNTLEFDELKIRLPFFIHRAFSMRQSSKETYLFTEPDLTVFKDFPNVDEEMKEAFRDSLKCFNNDLYRPAIVMAVTALEGAWIQLGLVLYELAKEKFGFDQTKYESKIDYLKGVTPITRKVEDINKFYSDYTHWFKDISDKTEINYKHLNKFKEWSNTVLGNRNSVHYGVEPITELKYEAVYAQLLSFKRYIFDLSKLFQSAKDELL